MNTTRLTVLTSSAALLLLGLYAATAGPLDPPAGPVASTMKTLDEIEPRTAITSLPMTISAPGSYYLPGPLSTAGDGITVEANNVTIDLMGFTITGPGPSAGDAITLDSLNYANMTVRNGTIDSFENGILAQEGLTDLPDGVTVQNVTVMNFGGSGMDLRVKNILVRDCFTEGADGSSYGIAVSGGVMTGCRAAGSGVGLGLYSGGVMSDCFATDCTIGIEVLESVVRGCAATNNLSQNLNLISGLVTDTYAP